MVRGRVAGAPTPDIWALRSSSHPYGPALQALLRPGGLPISAWGPPVGVPPHPLRARATVYGPALQVPPKSPPGGVVRIGAVGAITGLGALPINGLGASLGVPPNPLRARPTVYAPALQPPAAMVTGPPYSHSLRR
eukprot:gene15728-biopygen9739